ncbi:MAG TPA: hypothetical protein VF401_04195 [Candidatus Saccharimonadales bacterium]
MSIDFDACNVIASDASELAHQKMSTPKDRNFLYIFDDTAGWEPQAVATAHIGHACLSNHLSSSEWTNLLLVRPFDDPDADPQLVAILRDDLALPLATFTTRNEGACSYVRLAGENPDEDIIMQPRDKRKAVVDVMRAIIKNDKTFDSNSTESALHNFFEERMAAKAAEIERQLAPAFYRELRNYFLSSKKTRRPLWFANETDDVMQTFYVSPFGMGKAVLADERPVEILLASEEMLPRRRRADWNPALQVLAVARGSIAEPLFAIKENTIEDATTNTPIDASRVDALRNAFLAPAEEKDKYFDARRHYYRGGAERKLRRTKNDKDRLALLALFSVMDPEVSIFSRQSLSDKYVTEVDRINEMPNDWSHFHDAYLWDSPLNEESVKRLITMGICKRMYEIVAAHSYQPLNALLQTMPGASETFEARIGKYDERAEALLQKVGWLAAQHRKFSGTLKDQKIIDDKGDIYFEVTTERLDPDMYGLDIEARPSSMKSFELRPVFQRILLDRRSPILADQDEITEIKLYLDHVLATLD